MLLIQAVRLRKSSPCRVPAMASSTFESFFEVDGAQPHEDALTAGMEAAAGARRRRAYHANAPPPTATARPAAPPR